MLETETGALCHRAEHPHLAQELEKLKENLRERGTIADPATPHTKERGFRSWRVHRELPDTTRRRPAWEPSPQESRAQGMEERLLMVQLEHVDPDTLMPLWPAGPLVPV
ncbi:uncharacterized protein WM277_013069 isoform 2-T2 [Molossus nigricans]